MVAPRRFDDRDDARSWLASTFAAWRERLSPAQHEAVERYKGTEYRDLNDALRYGGDLDEDLRDDLDAALELFALREPVVSWRGIDDEMLRFAIDEGEDLVDDELDSPAYVSVSLIRDVAEDFLGGGDDVLLEITIPAGAHAGAYAGAPDLVLDLAEYEVLLPRETTMRITAVTPAGDDDYPTLHLEVLLP